MDQNRSNRPDEVAGAIRRAGEGERERERHGRSSVLFSLLPVQRCGFVIYKSADAAQTAIQAR